MSKKQQFTVSTGEVTAKKSEYDDEELDVVQGKTIEVKSGGGGGGAGTNGASKKYSTGGSECHLMMILNKTKYRQGL